MRAKTCSTDRPRSRARDDVDASTTTRMTRARETIARRATTDDGWNDDDAENVRDGQGRGGDGGSQGAYTSRAIAARRDAVTVRGAREGDEG